MKLVKFTALIALSLVFSVCWGDEGSEKQEKLHLSSSQTTKISIMVESVDYDSREVTLRDSSGELIEFIAGEEVQNLEQMYAGDIVIAEYTENFYIDVVENKGGTPGDGEFSAVGTAEKGLKPGMSAFESQVVTAIIEAINFEKGTYTLRWPDGSTEELTAQNPENLSKGEVGDMVIITRTLTVNISVEETSSE